MQFYKNFYQYGNQTLIREVKNGVTSKYKYKFQPTLYVPSENGEFKTIQGNPLSPVSFESVKEAKEFVSQYKDTPNYEICGNPRWAYSAIEELYPSVGELGIPFDSSFINVIYIDIETASGGERGFPNIETANHEVNAITMVFRDKSYTLGLEDIDPEVEGNKYIYCNDEPALLKQFIKLWKSMDPDIVTGWNVNFFDLTYLVNRIERILGDDYKELSPWGIVNKRQESVNDKPVACVEIVGVCILDYIPLYKKFRLKMQESYKLDHIAYVELGDKKLSHENTSDMYSLLWTSDGVHIPDNKEHELKDFEKWCKLKDKIKKVAKDRGII